ncbi:transmembrane protein [Mycobacterium tuberculosis]|nr:transmembrane protein [Mycobacterium tuberculosis]
MSVENSQIREPPPLPPVLLEVWPVIAVGALAWLVAAVAAFVVPGLASWRPVTVAGLATGLLGTTTSSGSSPLPAVAHAAHKPDSKPISTRNSHGRLPARVFNVDT